MFIKICPKMLRKIVVGEKLIFWHPRDIAEAFFVSWPRKVVESSFWALMNPNIHVYIQIYDLLINICPKMARKRVMGEKLTFLGTRKA